MNKRSLQRKEIKPMSQAEQATSPMHKRDWIVLAILNAHGYESHRALAKQSGYSLGLINMSLKKLEEKGYISGDYTITDKTRAYMEESKPKRAVILAAGAGLRMIPISRVPKALLKISGQPLIERIILQLHKAGVQEIHVVVGYQMEQLEYLIDKFGVSLIYEPDFAKHDTLHALRLAADYLENAYIVPCSVWFARSPFNVNEYFSWYAVSEFVDEESFVRINRLMELVRIDDDSAGNAMIGLAYLRRETARYLRDQLIEMDTHRKYSRERWELALFQGNKMVPYARVMLGQSAYEITTYEDLRDLDSESQDLRSRHLSLIGNVFSVDADDIYDISRIPAGMTNNLMRFSVNGKRYILRIPGVGSNELTNRVQEADVYAVLKDREISDRLVYISGETGYKIGEFFEDAHSCDSANWEEVRACMQLLRKLHDLKLEVPHRFEYLSRLEWYESLCSQEPSFADYSETREKVLELYSLMESMPSQQCLCHIDSVSDNFLFAEDRVFLIDWEYSGMCDPHIDIAMFCLYAEYDRQGVERVLNMYYGNELTDTDRFRVYCYIAAGGLLWTVWSEYKISYGVNYSQYAVKQYRLAKEYSQYAREALAAPGMVSKEIS